MTDEAVFLSALRERPNDETARLVYADWLEENGRPERAEFIRTEKELTELAEGDGRAAELRARLREMAAGLCPAWLAVVSKPPIENCRARRHALKFAYECPLRWDQLRPFGGLSERFCDSCRQVVQYCDTLELAREHAELGSCVAIDARVLRAEGDLPIPLEERGILMGLVRFPPAPEWDRPPEEAAPPAPRRKE
jgi:uncharacterized protein (TIGR02996 family)